MKKIPWDRDTMSPDEWKGLLGDRIVFDIMYGNPGAE